MSAPVVKERNEQGERCAMRSWLAAYSSAPGVSAKWGCRNRPSGYNPGVDEQSRSPRITYLAWGKIEIEGQDRVFKDVKVFPGGAREWDWTETGTSHSPGRAPSNTRLLQSR